MEFTKRNVRRWMRENAKKHEDSCGEVCCTSLVEGCCDEFLDGGVGDPLQNPHHWVWEVAVDIQEEYENR